MDSERNFKIGRNSEQFYNEELFKLYEAIKYLLSIPEGDNLEPEGNPIDGALWLDRAKNELNKYNRQDDKWENVFNNKFRITSEIMNYSRPESPVNGQLWIDQNGALMYYNNVEWQPIRASSHEDSNINLSTYQDFLILSPLSETGDVVLGEEEKYQYLVPSIRTGKFFVTRNYENDFERKNEVSFQYPISKTIGHVPSWVHINPGKLRRINKKLISINMNSHFIEMDPANTEFYAFKAGERFGRFLRPEHEGVGDYYLLHDGLYLNKDSGVAETFQYILAVTYEFSWIRSIGTLNRTSSEDQQMSYYMGGFGQPMNVFIDGYDLDSYFFTYHADSTVLNIDDPDFDQEHMENIIMRSIKREYGIIKALDIESKGIIKLKKKYNHPLVFVNGQALNASLGDVEIDAETGIILVNGAVKNMSYSIIELEWDTEEPEDDGTYIGEPEINTMFIKEGLSELLDEGEPEGEAVIKIENMEEVIPQEEGVILFIDGMIIKRDQVTRNYDEEYMTVEGLQAGQDFILLRDKHNSFIYDEDNMIEAIFTGKLDDSMVYMNNNLICSNEIITTQESQEAAGEKALDGEIKLFISELDLKSELELRIEDGLELDFSGEYKKWHNYNKVWVDLSESEKSEVEKIAFSYKNAIHAIALFPGVKENEEDSIDIYAYNYANTIENPLIISSFMADEEKAFNNQKMKHHFIPNTNSLQVYLDGIRQYDVVEYIDGSGFELTGKFTKKVVNESTGEITYEVTDKFTGKVTYIIERPEQGRVKACEREVLDYSDAVEGALNVYKTNISLYPGRLTVYIDGLRQPINSFTVVDNHTISFRDKGTRLINSSPVTYIDEGKEVEVEKKVFSKILIEVRQDFNKKERTIKVDRDDIQGIDLDHYDIKESILETQDEILIYLNGVFSGLKNNIGYLKNLGNKEISILSHDFIKALREDGLYSFLEENDEARIKYENQKGETIKKRLNNKIILEWR